MLGGAQGAARRVHVVHRVGTPRRPREWWLRHLSSNGFRGSDGAGVRNAFGWIQIARQHTVIASATESSSVWVVSMRWAFTQGPASYILAAMSGVTSE